ncbi:MAG: hypothetical protein AB7E72_06555 [Lysobacterales bacterium]
MREIFLAELRRFRRSGLILTLLHLAALAFCLRMIDPLQQRDVFYQLIGTAYGLLGLLFGLYQMGSYRRPNLWLQLLHRPVHQRRIGLGLILASVTLAAIAIALPLWLALLGQDLLTARVVDSRHYLLPLAIWLIVLCCYLAAAYTMLAPKRYSAAMLMLPLLLFSSAASGLYALLLQMLVLAWLLLAVLDAFKPDLTRPPASAGGTLLVGLPLQLGLYVLLVFAALGYQLAWIVVGTHPLNGTPPAGGYVEATRADGADLLDAALIDSKLPESSLWRQQIRLADTFAVAADASAYPLRQDLTNLSPTVLVDSDRREMWTFSQDSMRLQGVSLADRHELGSLGVGPENSAFTEVPLAIGDGLLLTREALYRYDSETRQVNRRIQLPAGESVAGALVPVGEALALLSDQALYFFDAREFARTQQPLTPRLRVVLHDAIGSLTRLDLIELLDGYLISEVYGRGSTDGPGTAYQILTRTDAQGRSQTVAERALTPDFPLALRYYAWWLSPALSALRQAAVNALSRPEPLSLRSETETPGAMVTLALVLMALSAAGSLWLGRRQGLSAGWRWAWVATCALLSLPGLLSQRLLYPDAERQIDHPARRRRPVESAAVSGSLS